MAGARSVPPFVAAVLALVLGACASNGTPASSGAASSTVPATSPVAASFPVTVTDDDGVAVMLPSAPRRIVTWAPSNTEILFALGLGSEVVGVSGAFDNYPPEAASITHVGGESGVSPNVEKVVSLHPDLVLNGFEGGEDWKAELRKLHVPVFSIYGSSFDDAIHDIQTVGRITGASGPAASVTNSMTATATQVEAAVAKEPPVSCFFEAYYPPLTTVGPHTFIFDVLKDAGCEPVSEGARSDYPQWSVDKLVQEDPQAYVAVSESATSAGAVSKRPGFAALGAVRDGHVYLVDSDLITRPGPRVVQALEALAKELHPAAFD
jgi:iron complex transport system substrate-binding protein